MNYEKLLTTLKKCWSKESSSKYERENPAKGQCSATAIVIQRKYGGEILKTKINGSWHFYNQIENFIYDFTSEQFAEKVEYINEKSSKEEALADCTEAQVAALWARLNKTIDENLG
jgi:hypothetical protein